MKIETRPNNGITVGDHFPIELNIQDMGTGLISSCQIQHLRGDRHFTQIIRKDLWLHLVQIPYDGIDFPEYIKDGEVIYDSRKDPLNNSSHDD